MNDQHSPHSGSSRRTLLAASVTATAGAGAAVLIGACGGSGTKTKSVETVSTTEAETDAAILNALLDLEHSSIAAYTAIAAKLRGPELQSALTFLGHERRHASALARFIRRLGGTPQPPRARSEYDATFPPLRGERDALSFALDLETTAIAAYADALGKIATDGVRATAASILVTESEHAAVVLGDLGRPQVPEAFVTGPPPDEGSG
jgi:rubrerythrin